MRYFGEPYPSAQRRAPIYEDAEQADTPVGEPCMFCDRPIEAGDRGFLMPHMSASLHASEKPCHRECLMENILGPNYRDYQ